MMVTTSQKTKIGPKHIMSFLVALQHYLRVDLQNGRACSYTRSGAQKLSGLITYGMFERVEVLDSIQNAGPPTG